MLIDEIHCSHLPQMKSTQLHCKSWTKEKGKKGKLKTSCSQRSTMMPIPLQMSLEILTPSI